MYRVTVSHFPTSSPAIYGTILLLLCSNHRYLPIFRTQLSPSILSSRLFPADYASLSTLVVYLFSCKILLYHSTILSFALILLLPLVYYFFSHASTVPQEECPNKELKEIKEGKRAQWPPDGRNDSGASAVQNDYKHEQRQRGRPGGSPAFGENVWSAGLVSGYNDANQR